MVCSACSAHSVASRLVSRRTAFIAAAVLAATCLGATAAHASRGLVIGITDPGALYNSPQANFALLKRLRAQAFRVNLYWGGSNGVARRRPTNAKDPNDPAYDWEAYDRAATYARRYGVKLVFSIYGTPAWANGGEDRRHAPTRPLDLQQFAFAAATRYSGTWMGEDGRRLPPVRYWLAWNEPNNPSQLWPQFRKVGRRWIVQSAVDYAKICKAVYAGVHSTILRGEKVGCGVTAPRGNNRAQSSRPSVSPLVFARVLKKAGLRRFDAYAHHPYYGSPRETPNTRPSSATRSITLGNINVLIDEVRRLWGPKRLWITEYGYQTNPPDSFFGVSYAKQALYLKQAYGIARANPRIDMMLWFLLRDEHRLMGWQSGLITAAGKRKPAFDAFRSLPR
jgi:hypothetical protein